jgi:hypothetical protein
VKKLLNLERKTLKFVIPTLAQQIWEGEYQFNKTKAQSNNQGKKRRHNKAK